MKLIILLLALLCGCSSAPPAQIPTPTPTPVAPRANAEFTEIHQHFHNDMVPAFRELYRSGAHFLRADAPLAERRKAARQLDVAFGQGISELKKVQEILASQPPAGGPLGRYTLATQAQVKAWLEEAVAYQAYVRLMLLQDPSQAPNIRQVVVDLEKAAQVRVAATGKGQKSFDLVFGARSKELTRPATVKAF